MNPNEKEEKKEEGGFFSGLFGTSKPNAPATETASAMDLPEIEPQGPALSEESQAGGAKKRKYHKRRTLRKRRSIRKSHKKSRKSMKSRKSRKSQKKH